MELARNHDQTFNRDAFARANVQISSLKANLPPEAVKALAREVVSRLAERAGTGPALADGWARPLPSTMEIDLLCTALVSDDLDSGARYIAQIRSDGTSVEVVLLAYLAAAARRLGEWWDDDRVSFTDVAIGASRIYAIMRGLRNVLSAPPEPAGSQRHAVFASVPDEIHTLGVTMAADLFRNRGWRIDLRVGLTHDELVAELSGGDCDLVGLSASGPRSIVALARLIVALRITRPGALIMVSGQIVHDERDRVRLLGADGIAWDITSAIAEMDRLAAVPTTARS